MVDPAPLLARLKQRKLVQWAVAYLAGAWLILQVVGLLAEPFSWPDLVLKAAAILLGIGFLGMLVLAWYHGERGAQRVTGVELLMLAGILVIAGAALAFVSGGSQRGGAKPVALPDKPSSQTVGAPSSIAVLPFTNVGGDPAQEYFSDGLTEEIIATLAQVPGLRVAAPTSSFYFKKQDRPVDEIGRRLHVATILEGSVRRGGERVRVTAQLIDVGSGYHIWSRVYERELSAVLSLEEDLARDIVDKLSLRLGAQTRKSTRSLEAFDHYLRGQHLIRAPDRSSVPLAIAEYQQAIAYDSTYARAYAALSDAYEYMAFWYVEPYAQAFPKADAALRRALALDSTVADAHAALGQLERWWRHDRPAAERAIRRALELDPELARAHEAYAWFLIDTRYTEEALREQQRAWQLDPFSVSQSLLLAELLRMSGDYDGAIRQAKLTLAMDSSHTPAWQIIGESLMMQGRASEAVSLLEKHRVAGDAAEPLLLAALGAAYARAGRAADARRLAADLEKRRQHEWIHPAGIAVIYAALNDPERSLQWLEKAERVGALWPELDAMPEFMLLHGQPRYVRLLRSLGIQAPQSRQ